MDGNDQQLKCAGCGKDFHSPIPEIGESFRPRRCVQCAVAQQAEWLAEEARANAKQKADKRDAMWRDVCPPSYRETDPSRLRPQSLAIVSAWTPSERGLGLVGETGRGKTRLLFLALRKCHEAGMSTAFISHNAFSRVVQGAFAGEEKERKADGKYLTHLNECDALLIDDLGKAPRTERADAEMEELIEWRTANGLPVLFTANASGEWLEKRFGEDRGPALVRRLGEFCDVHKL